MVISWCALYPEARAGLHLPTDPPRGGLGAAVPWTRHVLTDLGDAQSLDLEGGLSTFSAHLKRLQRILRASAEVR
jgi:DNA mismatch repair protein MutS2